MRIVALEHATPVLPLGLGRRARRVGRRGRQASGLANSQIGRTSM